MVLEIKKCDKCGNKFKQKVSKQRFCQDPCSLSTQATIEERNKAWILRKKRKNTAPTIKIGKSRKYVSD